MKKIFLLFLLFFLLLGVLSAWAYDYDVKVDGIYYNLDTKNKTASVADGLLRYEGAVVIPESIGVDGTTYSVTSLGEYCFSDCSGLTSIAIPNSVTSLERMCFRGCSGLTSITIPNSVTSLGYECFWGCSGLTSITIPNSVTSLGSVCFQRCSGLTEVHVNRETPPTTGGRIFHACESLQTIYVPIGASANYGVDPWNAYKIVEEDVQSGITAVIAEGAANAPVYHLNGRRAGTSKNFGTLPKGIYITNDKKVLR